MSSEPKAKAETKAWGEWAAERGHVHRLQRVTLTSPRRNPNRGIPDVRVVRAYYGWPVGLLMTAEAYDEAVAHVYSGPIYR